MDKMLLGSQGHCPNLLLFAPNIISEPVEIYIKISLQSS